MLGTAVVSGMLAATLLGVFFIPALFVIVERVAGRKPRPQAPEARAREAQEALSTVPPA